MTTAAGSFPGDDESLDGQWPEDMSTLREDQKIPSPRYRHAGPSAPWPWMDFEHDVADVPPQFSPSDHEPWSLYPRSHFRNWTPDPLRRCRMLMICEDQYMCQIHRVDVLKDGTFAKLSEEERTRRLPSDLAVTRQFWDELHVPVENIRVRALFIENITLSVLQILGARYDIEPFFFSSSANWIPSRYQENPHDRKGDHITVVLPFIRILDNQQERISPIPSNPDPIEYPEKEGSSRPLITDMKQIIDTQAPLILSDRKVLLQDLLAIHMVRSTESGTIISYHHHSDLQKTSAKRLRSLVQRIGDSVYWSKLFEKSKDPTFVFLAILWYALYAWDEALEILHEHLSKKLEARAIDAKTNKNYMRQLHHLHAHLLNYEQLLRNFRKSVEFVRDTPNPAMDHHSISDSERECSEKLLMLESENLLDEIERLEKQRQIQTDWIQNAMALTISTIHLEESATMRELTQAAKRDSAAITQIEYMTLIFLPANFLASAFGMSINSTQTLITYLKSTVILTVITVWLAIAVQDRSPLHPGGSHILRRIAWPVFLGCDLFRRMLTLIKEQTLRRKR